MTARKSLRKTKGKRVKTKSAGKKSTRVAAKKGRSSGTALKRKGTTRKAVKKGTSRPTVGTARKRAQKTVKKGTGKAASTSSRDTARPKKLSAKQRRDFRERLLKIREQIRNQIHSLKNGSLRREDNVVSEEDGTDAFDRQFALDLVRSEEDVLFQISEALQRLEDGTYGVCEGCEGLIEVPRLKALPFVRRCVRCQSELEKRSANFHRVSLPT